MTPKSALLLPLVVVMVVPFISPSEAVIMYDQPVWFNWGKTTLDIVILDVHDPLIADSIQDAITIWQNGISYWSSTLSLTFRVYWADSGTVPPLDFKPDIAFVPQGFMSVYAGNDGTEWYPTCYATAPMLVGWGSFIRVTTHELGHCLGLDHVFVNGVEYKPSEDIMGDGDGFRCPSNINVRALENVYSGSTATESTSSTTYAQAPTATFCL